MQAIIEGELNAVGGYIIDLRNNPGGIFEEAITIASYFLDDDNARIAETVRYMDSESNRNIIDTVWAVATLPSEAFHAFPRHAWGLTSRPLVLLTNHGSASASEVMAGALQVSFVALDLTDYAVRFAGCCIERAHLFHIT
jgi:carboxyl-terminal processing protease